MSDFSCNPSLDATRLATAYGCQKRLQIRDFLVPEAASALLNELEASSDWRLSVNRGEQIVDFSGEALADFTLKQHATLDQAVALGGRYGFQFRYDTVRLSANTTPDTRLARFAAFLSSPALIDFMRTLTGAPDIAFARTRRVTEPAISSPVMTTRSRPWAAGPLMSSICRETGTPIGAVSCCSMTNWAVYRAVTRPPSTASASSPSRSVTASAG